MKKVTILILFFSLGLFNLCFAQSVSEIQRTQEILEKERVLRERFNKEEKIFIKKIIVKGITLLSRDQIEQIIIPFQKHWLTKEDIGQILELIKQAYKQKGYIKHLIEISYQIKKKQLIIQVKEITD